jgi:hypothetical protein
MEKFDFEFDSFGKERRLLTRSQWREKGRMVDARDVDAVKKITTSSGRHLLLFSFEQTIERPIEGQLLKEEGTQRWR